MDKIEDNGMYIIEWTERYKTYFDKNLVKREREEVLRHRDVAQACVFLDGETSWMVTGQEWNGVYHEENEVRVLAMIDLKNCTCVPFNYGEPTDSATQQKESKDGNVETGNG